MSNATLSHLASTLGAVAFVVLAAGCHHSTGSAPVRPSGWDEVNIGYGTQPRRAVTGAVEAATEEQLADREGRTVEELLEGRFAGLDVARGPDGRYVLRIRGSLREPLVVVDGIPSPLGLANPLQDLVPGNIRSVVILKDAGSTAAYGARGAYGVILITTRRGR